jgi:hypothetical protein
MSASSCCLLALLVMVAGRPSDALAQPTAPPCTLLLGHGRNFDPAQAAQNQRWDRLNQVFNQAVREVLEEAGQRSVALVLPVSATDLAQNLLQVLDEAGRQGCSQVLETTVFANPGTQALIARLRLYPLLDSKGPLAAQARPRMGSVSFTSQRDFDLSPRGLERLRPQTLGREMGQEALGQLEKPAAAP